MRTFPIQAQVLMTSHKTLPRPIKIKKLRLFYKADEIHLKEICQAGIRLKYNGGGNAGGFGARGYK